MNRNKSLCRVLDVGELYGEVLSQSFSTRVVLSQIEYAAQVEHPPHANRNALLVFVEAGGYEKSVGRSEFGCGSGKLLFVPEEHGQSRRPDLARFACRWSYCPVRSGASGMV